MPEYESCHGFLNMLDAFKGLPPGNPVKTAERIIESMDKESAQERVADYEIQTELAAPTDYLAGE